jgi:hypothetical protein
MALRTAALPPRKLSRTFSLLPTPSSAKATSCGCTSIGLDAQEEEAGSGLTSVSSETGSSSTRLWDDGRTGM